jgi:hypothetical protein
MRTTSLKTVYLTIPELKEAIAGYIEMRRARTACLLTATMDPDGLYTHMMKNEWSMDWAPDGEEFAISIDGEIKDK